MRRRVFTNMLWRGKGKVRPNKEDAYGRSWADALYQVLGGRGNGQMSGGQCRNTVQLDDVESRRPSQHADTQTDTHAVSWPTEERSHLDRADRRLMTSIDHC